MVKPWRVPGTGDPPGFTNYGKKSFSLNEDFVMELGDVLFSLLFIANLAGATLEYVFAKAMAKMEDRAEKSY